MTHPLQNPTVVISQWGPPYDDPTTPPFIYSPQTNTYVTSLQRYLPSPTESPDSFSCDSFRMYEFKVRECTRVGSHDWTECPYAHPGEKARRRDPRKHHYSGNTCPEFRRGGCSRGDTCELAHGVFECWLHPARYRTQPCKDGTHCRRRVCFFAHSPCQLRVLVGPMRGLHVGAGLSDDTWRPGIGGEEKGMENSLGCDRVESASYGPDFGWVSELVK